LKSLAEITQDNGTYVSGFYTAVQCGRWVVDIVAVGSTGVVSYDRASGFMSSAIGRLKAVDTPSLQSGWSEPN
jgi:hypothetical protein